MTLKLRQIEVFRAVMMTGSISAAAELLFVSQPAVSRLLSYTEASVGFTLFERIKGRLFATPEAKELFAEVESAYVGIQRVNDKVRELAENRHGVLRLVAHASIGSKLIPRAVQAFHQQHPEINLLFECLRQPLLKERVLNQQVDLAITLFTIDHPSLAAIPLCQSSLVCVFPAGHPLSRLKEIGPSDLRDQALIGYKHDSPTGILMRNVFEQAGEPTKPKIIVGTPQEACALVEAGLGVAVVDEFSAYGCEDDNLCTRPLVGAPPLQASLIHMRYEPLSKPTRAFIGILRDVMRERNYGQAVHGVALPRLVPMKA